MYWYSKIDVERDCWHYQEKEHKVKQQTYREPRSARRILLGILDHYILSIRLLQIRSYLDLK